jgi:hypothetical protein
MANSGTDSAAVKFSMTARLKLQKRAIWPVYRLEIQHEPNRNLFHFLGDAIRQANALSRRHNRKRLWN